MWSHGPLLAHSHHPGQRPAHPGPNTILLPAGTYHLTLPSAGEDVSLTGDLDITDDPVIKGDGAATTIIDATGLGDRVLQVIAGNVKISRVTLRGGRPPDGSGGGILNSGNLELTDYVMTRAESKNRRCDKKLIPIWSHWPTAWKKRAARLALKWKGSSDEPTYPVAIGSHC